MLTFKSLQRSSCVTPGLPPSPKEVQGGAARGVLATGVLARGGLVYCNTSGGLGCRSISNWRSSIRLTSASSHNRCCSSRAIAAALQCLWELYRYAETWSNEEGIYNRSDKEKREFLWDPQAFWRFENAKMNIGGAFIGVRLAAFQCLIPAF